MTAHRPPSVRHPRIDVGRRPFIVIWEMTRACDLACQHCRAEARPLRNPLELNTREARALIDEIASFGAPPPLFVMTGGDPMKRPDLIELIAYAASRQLPVAFSPSATPLLTRGVIAELKAAGLKALSMSVDGSEPGIHDAFRGIDGVFERGAAADRDQHKAAPDHRAAGAHEMGHARQIKQVQPRNGRVDLDFNPELTRRLPCRHGALEHAVDAAKRVVNPGL